jgi:hypothetical protein
MKSIKITLSIALLLISQLVLPQQASSPWEKWNYLIGEWVGEGNGKPGQGEGSFTFKTDLDGKILVRKNHTVFPATEKSKALTHDDLLIIYQNNPDSQQKAIYFDNEGNTIEYLVSFTDKAVVLTSATNSTGPRFRLSYVSIDQKTVNIVFEIASPQSPEEFKVYLSGKAYKKE